MTSDSESSHRRVSLRSVYWFSYKLAFRSASPKHIKSTARLLLEPCSYWRNIEIPETLSRLDVQRAERVLDVGSPKLPSLFLAKSREAEVYATDLFPYFLEEYKHYLECLDDSALAARYHMEVCDARALHYPSEFFDKAYAISVIEHIEGGGDSAAMREIARVLKPGGLVCLTVPFAAKYRESTTKRKLYYKQHEPNAPVFFERHYDPGTLGSRLIHPSGLSLLDLQYYGERWFRYEHRYRGLPKLLKLAASVLSPLAASLFLHPVGREVEKAETAILLLQKPVSS